MLKRAPVPLPDQLPDQERLKGVQFLEGLAAEILSALGLSHPQLRYVRTVELSQVEREAGTSEPRGWLALRREADSLEFSCSFAAPHVALSKYTLTLLVNEHADARFSFADSVTFSGAHIYEHLIRVFDQEGVTCGTLTLRTRELPAQVSTSSEAQLLEGERVLLQLSTRIPLITSRHEISAPLFAWLSICGTGCFEDPWRVSGQGFGLDAWCRPVMLNVATQKEKMICELVEKRSVMATADEKAFLTLDLGAIELSVDEFFSLRTGSRLAFDLPVTTDVLLRYDGRPVAKANLQMSDKRLSLEISDVFALPAQKAGHDRKSEWTGN